MAVAPILAPSTSPADPALDAVATALKQTLAIDPQYGVPFCRALDRAVRYMGEGIQYESFNATHYRVQSHSTRWVSHYVTLHACSCDTISPWCWHRALLHLLTAHAALRHLDRCPRPMLAAVPMRRPRDMVTILREADELY